MDETSSYEDRLLSIEALAREHDVELVAVRPWSSHPDDWYLYRVICRKQKPVLLGHDYIVWTANVSGYPNFFKGHYDLDLEAALDLFDKRKKFPDRVYG